jgi:hypothetical protein
LGGLFQPQPAVHYLIVVIAIIIGHETTAAACWALLLIVRTLFNDAITVAVWTGFHVRLLTDSFHEPNSSKSK